MPPKRSVNPELDEILARPENRFCADCNAKAPRWASVNLGVLVCLDCSGAHRNMGTHISFVQSVSLDTKRWQQKWIDACSKIGNRISNEYYERHLPDTFKKPKEGSPGPMVYNWIRDKYDLRKYAPRGVPTPAERLAQGQDPNTRGSRNRSTSTCDRDRSVSCERRRRASPRRGQKTPSPRRGQRTPSPRRRERTPSPRACHGEDRSLPCIKQKTDIVDLLGGFDVVGVVSTIVVAESVPTSVITDNWASFSSTPCVQQPPQEQPTQMDCLAQDLDALNFNNSNTQVSAELQPSLPTLLTTRPNEEPLNDKVGDVQKSLASLYAQPKDNRFSALEVVQQMPRVLPQMNGMQQFGDMQQMHGMPMMGMPTQQCGGAQQMMGMAMQQTCGMQQFGGMQQVCGQQTSGMQQFGGMQHMIGVLQFGGTQQMMSMHPCVGVGAPQMGFGP